MAGGAHSEHKQGGNISFIISLIFVTSLVLAITWYVLCYLKTNGIVDKEPIELMTGILQSSAVFLFSWLILGNAVYKPFFALLEEREAKTSGNTELAKEKLKEKKSLEEKIEEELRELRIQAARDRDARLVSAKASASKVITEAQEIAANKLTSAQQEVAELLKGVEGDIEKEVERLSQIVFEQALSSPQQIH